MPEPFQNPGSSASPMLLPLRPHAAVHRAHISSENSPGLAVMTFSPTGSCMGARLVRNGTGNGGADSAVLAASRANQDAITLPPPGMRDPETVQRDNV